MDTNVSTIDTLCSIPTSPPAPRQCAENSEDKKFSMILDNVPSEAAPCEFTTPDNVDENNQKKDIEKTPDDSATPFCEESESKVDLEAQDGTGSEQLNSVLVTIEPSLLESAMTSEKNGVNERTSEAKGKAKISLQIAPWIPISKSDSSALVTEVVPESSIIGTPSTDEDQILSESVLINSSEKKPFVKIPLESMENPDIGSKSTPTTAIPEITSPAETGNTGEPISERPADMHEIKATNTNKLTIPDTSAALEPSGRQKPVAADFVAEGSSEESVKIPFEGTKAPTTTDSHPASAPAIRAETQPDIEKIDLDKPASTEETFSESLNSHSNQSYESENNPSNAPENKDFSIHESQLLSSPSEDQGRSIDNPYRQIHLEQMVTENNVPTQNTQPSDTFVANTKAADVQEQMAPNEISSDVGKQVLQSIQRAMTQPGGDQHIAIRLNPPELGKVLIRFHEHDSELSGLLEVTKAETRVEIEQALPQMIRDLADSGIQIRRLDVMLSEEDRSGYGNSGDSSLQNNEAFEQDSANSQTQDNQSYSNGIYDWLSNNENYQHITEWHESQITDGSVNVLI